MRRLQVQIKASVDFEEELADIQAYDAAKPKVMADLATGESATLAGYRARRAKSR